MNVRLRAAFGRQFAIGDQTYHAGDELDVPEATALAMLRSGLVVPSDGNWQGVIPEPAAPAAAEPAAVSDHPAGECDPGPKPARGAMQTCPVAGCPCLTWAGKCRAHARTRSDGRAYATGHRNVSSALHRRWASVRRNYLGEHPTCECAECVAQPEPLRPAASEVDHIDGLGLLGPRAFEPANLQSLTKGHHSRKTAGESFGH